MKGSKRSVMTKISTYRQVATKVHCRVIVISYCVGRETMVYSGILVPAHT